MSVSPVLGARLRAISDLVPSGVYVADIGADHGLLVIALVRLGKIPGAYASENKSGPFKKLQRAVAEAGLASLITVDLADGLARLPQKTTVTVIAGMGGFLTANILKTGQERLKTVKTLILAPHSEAAEARKAVQSVGFRIIREDLVSERGHLYPLIVAEPGEAHYEALDLAYGPCLRRDRSPLFRQMVSDRIARIDLVLKKPLDDDRRKALTEEKEQLLTL